MVRLQLILTFLFIEIRLLFTWTVESEGKEGRNKFLQCGTRYDDFENEPSNSTTTTRFSVVGRYARYDEILRWLDDLCCSYPEIVKTYDIGKTSEGRSMIVLRIGLRNFSSSSSSSKKWSIWLDGGIHAREHISPATVIFIADQLVQGYRSKDADVLQMLEKIDWYLLPVLNPDGYEYSHTQNRLWRKNRRRINDFCVGVDLNRNWKVDWGGADSDNDPCSDMFAGDRAESEVEVRNVVNFILPHSSQFIAFLTYHSYGQRIFTRWDFSGLEKPEDDEDMIMLANSYSDAISEIDGKDYKVGRAPDLQYAFGGGSADWAKSVAGIKYSYLIELRDNGDRGFLLPENEIVPTGTENWAGIKVITSHIIKVHGRDGFNGQLFLDNDSSSTSSVIHRQRLCEKEPKVALHVGDEITATVSSGGGAVDGKLGLIWTAEKFFVLTIISITQTYSLFFKFGTLPIY